MQNRTLPKWPSFTKILLLSKYKLLQTTRVEQIQSCCLGCISYKFQHGCRRRLSLSSADPKAHSVLDGMVACQGITTSQQTKEWCFHGVNELLLVLSDALVTVDVDIFVRRITSKALMLSCTVNCWCYISRICSRFPLALRVALGVAAAASKFWEGSRSVLVRFWVWKSAKCQMLSLFVNFKHLWISSGRSASTSAIHAKAPSSASRHEKHGANQLSLFHMWRMSQNPLKIGWWIDFRAAA